jgi:hypothetical protein
MWATLAIATALSLAPNQSAVKLTNARATYGVLGPVRTDMKFLPGDMLFLNYDIEGLTPDKKGAVQFEASFELKDKNGEVVYKQKPQAKEVIRSLGGTTVPELSYVELGVNAEPGDVTMIVTVKDLVSKKEAKLERKFTILKKAFGLTRVRLSFDDRVKIDAPVVLFPGQTVYFNYVVVGFMLDKKNRADLTLKLTVLDDKGKPTMKEPLIGEVKEAFGVVLPMQANIAVNRPGKFKIVIEATDGNTKKSVTESLNITVLESPSAGK